MENVLTIRDLSSGFATKKGMAVAIERINMDVPKGKIIGVVGESGCGKSLTAMSIMGLIKKPGRVLGGSICLEDRELTQLNKREYARIRGNEISMIFQEPMTSLNPVVTAGRQVQEAILIHERIAPGKARQRVLDIFEEVGIPEPEKRYEAYPHQLSGGLRQRVMIGMAMVCRPKLLIADEPTTALDVTIEAQILRLMKELCQKNGTSIILITHNLGVVAQVCDYVYVMYAGHIVEQGDTFSLFEHTAHPYTRGLMRSIPGMDPLAKRLYTIPGMVPNIMNFPRGCRFCTRCPLAQERCEGELPEFVFPREDHGVRCFKHGELNG